MRLFIKIFSAPVVFSLSVLVVLLLSAELFARVALATSGLAARPYIMSGPDDICARLVWFQSQQSPKVVVIGDSVVLGAVMGEHGVGDWRDHTLSAQIEVQANEAGQDLLALNLGMNGLLPADVEMIIGWVANAGADAVVMDLSLRSFSDDFASYSTRFSRPAFEGLSDSLCARNGSSDRASLDTVRLQIIRNSGLARLIIMGRGNLFGESPRAAVEEWWTGVRTNAVSEVNDRNRLMQIVLQARERYQSIRIADDSPQAIALQSTMRRAHDAHVPLLIFYAHEARFVRNALLNDGEFEQHLDELFAVVERGGEDSTSYTADYPVLDREQYIDHVHLYPSGYRAVARQLWPMIAQQID